LTGTQENHLPIWAIADTHLSFYKGATMDRFGEKWVNHTTRLLENWCAQITEEDTVLLPGDISWAQSEKAVMPDLEWLKNLPGKKVLLRGNHDHWWDKKDTARHLAEPLGIAVVEGEAAIFDGVVVCGAMGHVAPNDPYYRQDPKKDRYARELGRLEAALKDAQTKRTADQPIILMMHYPPFTSKGERTGFVDLISQYQPNFCLYGHLHHDYEWEVAIKSEYEGVHYILVAADYLAMQPRRIYPPG
jgi:uncharacterized protein